jgi:hypothetical protein
MILVSMILMLFTYQLTSGSYYFVYVSQVANESQNSVAVFTLWSMALFYSLTTSILISTLGIVGTFSLFAIISLAGGLYYIY